MKIEDIVSHKLVEIDCNKNTTLDELQTTIEDNFGIPSKFQQIHCDGLSLKLDNPEKSLYKMGLTNDSTLVASSYLEGGCGLGCRCCGNRAGCGCVVM